MWCEVKIQFYLSSYKIIAPWCIETFTFHSSVSIVTQFRRLTPIHIHTCLYSLAYKADTPHSRFLCSRIAGHFVARKQLMTVKLLAMRPIKFRKCSGMNQLKQEMENHFLKNGEMENHFLKNISYFLLAIGNFEPFFYVFILWELMYISALQKEYKMRKKLKVSHYIIHDK